MILRILKTNKPVNYIIFPVVGLILWLVNLIHPEEYPFFTCENKNVLYNPLHLLVNNLLFIQALLSLLIAIVLAFIMQQINSRYSFVRIRNMIPASLFMVFTGGMINLHTIHPVYFGSLFLLIALYRLFGIFDKLKPYNIAFDVGFLIGTGSLFYFGLLFIFPAFLVGIGILGRYIRWRSYVISVVGFFLPVIFALSIGILTGNFLEILKAFELNIRTPNNQFEIKTVLLIFYGFLALITLLGSIRMIFQYDTKKVSSRKYFVVLFLVFICSLLALVLIPAISIEILLVTAIPVTYLISNYLAFMKIRWQGDLIFTVFLILAIIQQFF